MSLLLAVVPDPATSLSAVALAPLVAMLVSGVLIPMVIDFVADSTAAPGLKSLLAAGLSVLAGVVSTVVWTPGTSIAVYLVNIATAFVVSMAAHKAGVSDAIERARPEGWFPSKDPPAGKHSKKEG